MPVNRKIGRLCARIDALAEKRWGGLRMEDLTDEAWAKIDQLVATAPRDGRSNAGAHLSDNAILRILVDAGVLTAADFRGP